MSDQNKIEIVVENNIDDETKEELQEEIKEGDDETREELEEKIEDIKEELEENQDEIIEQIDETKEEIKTWLENALTPIAQAITTLSALTVENQERLKSLETATTPDPLTPPPSMTDLNETPTETLLLEQTESPEENAGENQELLEETQAVINRAGREVIRL